MVSDQIRVRLTDVTGKILRSIPFHSILFHSVLFSFVLMFLQ